MAAVEEWARGAVKFCSGGKDGLVLLVQDRLLRLRKLLVAD